MILEGLSQTWRLSLRTLHFLREVKNICCHDSGDKIMKLQTKVQMRKTLINKEKPEGNVDHRSLDRTTQCNHKWSQARCFLCWSQVRKNAEDCVRKGIQL